MYCPGCGCENDDAVKFCIKCGAALENGYSDDNFEEPTTESEYDQYFSDSENMFTDNVSKKNTAILSDVRQRKRIIIIVVVTLLILIAVVGTVAGKNIHKSQQWQKYYDLGQKYLTESDYDKAIAAFTNAINIDSKNSLAYVGRGDAYTNQADEISDLSAALELYKKASGDYSKAKDGGEKSAAGKYADSQAKIVHVQSSSETGKVLGSYTDIDISAAQPAGESVSKDTTSKTNNNSTQQTTNKSNNTSSSNRSESDKSTSNKKSAADGSKSNSTTGGNTQSENKKSENTKTEAKDTSNDGNDSKKDNSSDTVASPPNLSYASPSDLTQY